MINKTLIGLVGFFVSSESVWSMAASGLFKSILGNNYVMVQPQFITLVAIVSYLVVAGLQVKVGFFIVCASFLSVGLYEWIATYLGEGNVVWAYQQFVFGFLYPVLMVLIVDVMDKERRLLFFRWFYLGYCVYLMVSIFLLFFIDGILTRQFNSYGIGGALISMRYQFDDNLFLLILGNANKQSNYLIMAILLGPYLLGLGNNEKDRGDLDLIVYKVFVLLASFVLVVLFSRAVIFLLPIALYLNRKYLLRLSKSVIFLSLMSAIALCTIFYDELTIVLNYLLFSEYLDGESKGALGSFGSRINQWSEFARILSDPAVSLHGLGVGTYGGRYLDCSACGTHNLFLDHWLASGLFGVFVIWSVIVSGLVASLVKRDLTLVIGYFFFIALSFREYSFSYLYVTSMGGVVFALLIMLTFGGSRKERAQMHNSTTEYTASIGLS